MHKLVCINNAIFPSFLVAGSKSFPEQQNEFTILVTPLMVSSDYNPIYGLSRKWRQNFNKRLLNWEIEKSRVSTSDA